MKFILTVIGVVTSLFYLILFGILISKNFVFDGHLTINYDFSNESPFISLLKPRGRLNQSIQTVGEDSYQIIKVDPVYFDVNLPRQFKTAKVKIKYKNPIEPLLELGISAGKDSPNFFLQPLENKLLDKLEKDTKWSKLKEDNIILYQKDSTYKTIDEFVSNIPSDKKIAVYNYKIPLTYKIKNYKAAKGIEINKSIRGSHEMYTYVGPGQDLDFNFNLQDVNRGIGNDDIKIEVFYYERHVYNESLQIDKIEDDSAFMSQPFDYDLFIKKPPVGLYKIKIIASDDIFIRKIKSSQQHLLAFINGIYLGDNVGYLNEYDLSRYDATTLFTTTEKLASITAHKEGFQNIKFGDKDLSIDEEHIMFVRSNSLSQRKKWLEPIITEHDDIKLLGKGLFFFNKEHYFDPTYLSLSGDPSLDLEKYNIGYIIAKYKSPEKEGDWSVQTLEYDLEIHADKDNSYRFAFSFPYSQVLETNIMISDITIDLFTDPIGIKDFFKKSFNQFKKFVQ